MRKKVIAGNWKMNKVSSEAESFIEEVTKDLKVDSTVEAVICAPFPYLTMLVDKAKGSQIKIGAQTMHYESSGAYTGEVSPDMLQDIGVTYVIIGHSERRQYFAETDDTVNKKVQAAYKNSLKPIVCVGETLEQREAGVTKDHVETQVKAAIKGLTNEQISKLIIAYEPIWAIGTGKTASNSEANEVCTHIRQVIKQATTDETGEHVTIQYGGSVNEENIQDLLKETDIDGALVGGASLVPQSFRQLLGEQ